MKTRISVILLSAFPLIPFASPHSRFNLRKRGYHQHVHVLHHHMQPEPPIAQVTLKISSDLTLASESSSYRPGDPMPPLSRTTTAPATDAGLSIQPSASTVEFEPQPQLISFAPSPATPTALKLAARQAQKTIPSMSGMTFLGESEEDDYVVWRQQYKEMHGQGREGWKSCKVLKYGTCSDVNADMVEIQSVA